MSGGAGIDSNSVWSHSLFLEQWEQILEANTTEKGLDYLELEKKVWKGRLRQEHEDFQSSYI